MAPPDAKPRQAFLGLSADEAGRVDALRQRGEYFWLDLDLDSPGAGRLGELLKVPEHPMKVLLDFESSTSIFRQGYVDDAQVVFPFFCVGDPSAPPLGADGMQPLEVHVLVHGDHLITVHHGPCPPLQELAGERPRVMRSEEHLIYRVLQQMVGTVFESLASLDTEAARVEQEFDQPHTGRRHLAFIREGRARLTRLRGKVAPQLAVFERMAGEIPHVKGLAGDEHHYFANVRAQLNHAIGAIDAANERLGALLEFRLNRTTFLLTIVATLFLPATFIAGFFGQNFGWLLTRQESGAAFWLLGIGLVVVSMASSLWLIYRQLGPRHGYQRSP